MYNTPTHVANSFTAASLHTALAEGKIIPITRRELGLYLSHQLRQLGLNPSRAAIQMKMQQTCIYNICNGQTRLSPRIANGLSALGLPGKALYLSQALNEYKEAKSTLQQGSSSAAPKGA